MPDLQTGHYILVSCPGRYEIEVKGLANGSFAYLAQACTPCPASRYCPGGTDRSAPCPGGTFALPGSAASSADCLPTTFVSITIQVEASISSVTQPALLQAVASAASVSVDSVFLVGATARAENSSLVEVRIAADGIPQAHRVCSSLDSTKLSLALARSGLPVCYLLSCALDGQPLGTWNEVLTTVVIGSAVGAVLLCTICIGFIYKCQNKEENEMMRATKELRNRLRIERGDGYLLGSDWIYPWQRSTNAMHLHKSCVESATKLSLLRDFNPLEFDVFCICLIQPAQAPAGRSVQHVALYDWILEIGKWLLKPSINFDKSCINPETGREWTERERFAYLEKLCKCQVQKSTDRYWFDNRLGVCHIQMHATFLCTPHLLLKEVKHNKS
jgi:hypothetical protein